MLWSTENVARVQIFKTTQPPNNIKTNTTDCLYIHTHTYIHTYIQTYIHTYIHTYKHTYKHTYMALMQSVSQYFSHLHIIYSLYVTIYCTASMQPNVMAWTVVLLSWTTPAQAAKKTTLSEDQYECNDYIGQEEWKPRWKPQESQRELAFTCVDARMNKSLNRNRSAQLPTLISIHWAATANFTCRVSTTITVHMSWSGPLCITCGTCRFVYLRVHPVVSAPSVAFPWWQMWLRMMRMWLLKQTFNIRDSSATLSMWI